MIEYKTYNRIINYLNKGDMENLKLYLEKEKNEYYINKAGKALTEYLNSWNHPYYDYFDENKLIIANDHGAYILNSDEILTSHRKKTLLEMKRIYIYERIEVIKKFLKKYEDMNKIKVDHINIRDNNSSQYIITNDEYNLNRIIYKKYIDYAKDFLGDEVTCYLYDDKTPTCKFESPKGYGLVLGIKQNSN